MEMQLASKLEHVKRIATALGLAVFPVLPDLPMLGKGNPSIQCPLVEWTTEDCDGFLKFAQQASVSIIYADHRKFCLNDVYREALEVLTGESVNESQLAEEHAWYFERFEERTSQFRSYDGETDRIACMWFVDGVAHRLVLTSPWSDECCTIVEAIVAEILEDRGTQRKARSEQEALHLLKLAGQLARHERFGEATNEAKREFMAKQVFPKEAGEHRHLAELAALIYWWDVEPQERTTKAERARELHRRGESIKNIAAMLKLPESKVRAAIAAD